MGTYTVKPHQTLYVIGRETGIPWQELARINGIRAPYTIFPGQKIRLRDAQPTTPQPYQYLHSTRTYGRDKRQVGIHVVKFRIAELHPRIVWPTGRIETVSGMAKRTGAVIAINASFWHNGVAVGRHISDGKQIVASPVARPIIILDDWTMSTGLEWTTHLIDRGVKDCFASYPTLIENGKINFSEHGAALAAPSPRTAIGRTDDDRIVIVVVDVANRAIHKGVTLAELAGILWQEGARKWALNLDGGGSSTLAINGAVRNRPSDGGVQRGVINSLCLVAK